MLCSEMTNAKRSRIRFKSADRYGFILPCVHLPMRLGTVAELNRIYHFVLVHLSLHKIPC